MLLLVTLGLVLVALVTLVIGVFSNQLQPIYISIVASIVAAVLLGLISRLNRRKASDVTTADAPAPLPPDEPHTDRAAGRQSDEGRPAPAAQIPKVGPDSKPAGEGPGASAPPDEEWARRQGGAAAGTPRAHDTSAHEGIFPIQDYDELRLGEIYPLLDQLEEDELAEVRAREYDGQRRSAILDRIDELSGGGRGSRPAPATSGERAFLPLPAAAAAFQPQDTQVAEPADAPMPAAATAFQPQDTRPVEPVAAAAFQPASSEGEESDRSAPADDGASRAGGESPFPIENYGELRVAQILILLGELDSGELEQVAAHERQGANRNTILNRIDRLQRTGPATSPKDAAPAK